MSDKFDWHISEEEREYPYQPNDESGRGGRGCGYWLFTAVLLLLIIGGWGYTRYQLQQEENDLNHRVQAVLDFEREAFLAGDGDLFFSSMINDSTWFAAQLLPENQAVYQAGAQTTATQLHDDYIWANVTWTENDESWQRVMFFQMENDRLVHVPSAPTYWGKEVRFRADWGVLQLNENDREWAEQIMAYVDDVIDEVCRADCLEDQLPLTLVLTGNYGQTAVPNTLHIPSPRLLALDDKGEPAALFWQTLRQRLVSQLTPATIRFAVPPLQLQNGQALVDYQKAADLFMALHPDIIIEIIYLDELPADLAMLTVEYDGAAIAPTQAMLAAGLVHDLTDYIGTDPDFDVADFYPQIWQGAKWQDQVWFMPQAATMQVLFYDKAAYELADISEPSLRWTWGEMARDISGIVSVQPESTYLSWGFLDTSLDSLFSYAYNWNNECTEQVTVLCQTPLETQNMAVALDWYSQMVAGNEQMPDLTGLTTDDHDSVLLNLQTSRRQAAVWADLPVNYEHQLLLSAIGVVPFPGSDRFDGITPLRVQGSFISQRSERPLAMWQWLKFLSYQRPTPRLIPTRPSVASQTGYWVTLPRPLGDVMRTAFPFARPVTIAEKEMLTWEQVTAVVSGEATVTEAAGRQPDLTWFNNP